MYMVIFIVSFVLINVHVFKLKNSYLKSFFIVIFVFIFKLHDEIVIENSHIFFFLLKTTNFKWHALGDCSVSSTTFERL